MNVSALRNVKKLDVDIQILFTLYACADEHGRVGISPKALTHYVKRPLRRIYARLEALESAGVLFYDVDSIQFNPTFYNGTR